MIKEKYKTIKNFLKNFKNFLLFIFWTQSVIRFISRPLTKIICFCYAYKILL